LMKSSALQRAEIAEIAEGVEVHDYRDQVSVLFNEPKLLKLRRRHAGA